MDVRIPLGVQKGRLWKAQDMKTSIDSYIGFIFNNLRFEIFDENEGVVLNSDLEHSAIYEKKISGSSRNINTFAVELKRLIEKYEKRLSDVLVTMSYIREHRKIYITVRGTIIETKAEYKYQTTLNVWN